MKKEKLKLNDLKVKSFVTRLGDDNAIKGGVRTEWHCPTGSKPCQTDRTCPGWC
ncbi:pinensin family lanthipeptide [Fulvivirga imtechensis]|uniref:pinensin family lanthipeptide n=1 Tax=Fulvivirga imtechensis TaxID=881893 RepID=UPI001C87A046